MSASGASRSGVTTKKNQIVNELSAKNKGDIKMFLEKLFEHANQFTKAEMIEMVSEFQQI